MFKYQEVAQVWSLPLLKITLKQDTIDQLIELSDEWLVKGRSYDDTLAGEIKVGSQKEMQFPENFDVREPCLKYIKDFFQFPIEHTKENLKVEDSWVVSQYAGDYNPVHSHGSDLSGIIYLKVPKQIPKSYATINPNGVNVLDGCLHFIFSNYHNRSLQNMGPRAICPRPGDMYIFPAYILHTVYPFKGDGERRSLSFNVNILGK
jgi:hypothetical protein